MMTTKPLTWRMWTASTGIGVLTSLLVTVLLLVGHHVGILPDFTVNRWFLVVTAPLIGTIVASEYLKRRGVDA